MPSIPENATEIETFILNSVLHQIDLHPEESGDLLSYLNDRHEYLFGPHRTYFVLGSYERPFKFRMEMALDMLNHRHEAYAYLLGTQPDPDVSDDLPGLKVKFYVHALYADIIPVILEHNTGGALVELGRVDQPFLLERVYVLPRSPEERYTDYDAFENIEDYYARAVELAYHYEGDEFGTRIENLCHHAAANDRNLTKDDLIEYLDAELDGRNPSYSRVLTDGVKHYDRVGRCFPWTTNGELREQVKLLP